MKKYTRLVIIILGAIVILCSIIGFGFREQHGPTKKEFTGAVVAQWAQYFRLYHELNKPPATSLEAVLDIVAKVARKSVPSIAKAYDEKIYKENKKHLLIDSWGNEIIFRYEVRSNNELWVVVISKGPDGKLDTPDDITAEIQVESQKTLETETAERTAKEVRTAKGGRPSNVKNFYK